MIKLSPTAIRHIESVSRQCHDEVIMKMCDHLLESKNDDIENTVNILIEDTKFYKPINSTLVGELFIAVCTDANKVQLKRPKR